MYFKNVRSAYIDRRDGYTSYFIQGDPHFGYVKDGIQCYLKPIKINKNEVDII